MAFCKECGIPDVRGHADWCSTQPIEVQVVGLRARVKLMKDSYDHQGRMWQSASRAARTWEGKFHQVKRENNALRRKLFVQEGKKRPRAEAPDAAE